MRVYIASDHGGFEAKKHLIEKLSLAYDLVDLGPESLNPNDDYPVYAEKVAKKVVEDRGSMGILTCRSGEGMEIAANKIDGVRAVAAWNTAVAEESRKDNDSNVLSLAADQLNTEQMIEISKTWLGTQFSNQPRHQRRLEQIEKLEEEN